MICLRVKPTQQTFVQYLFVYYFLQYLHPSGFERVSITHCRGSHQDALGVQRRFCFLLLRCRRCSRNSPGDAPRKPALCSDRSPLLRSSEQLGSNMQPSGDEKHPRISTKISITDTETHIKPIHSSDPRRNRDPEPRSAPHQSRRVSPELHTETGGSPPPDSAASAETP